MVVPVPARLSDIDTRVIPLPHNKYSEDKQENNSKNKKENNSEDKQENNSEDEQENNSEDEQENNSENEQLEEDNIQDEPPPTTSIQLPNTNIMLIDTILLENWSGFRLVLDQTTLSLSHQHGKPKNRSHFMKLHALPLLDLWFAANARANVQTVAANAKKKGVCVLLIAILAQGIIHVLIQPKY
ncbi:hypothetical protein EV426DRAFT_575842 [Tirmania nivea]|nr:hypothetical protein EV426DRAFT_575842 [Tirmania nivea]